MIGKYRESTWLGHSHFDVIYTYIGVCSGVLNAPGLRNAW